MKIDLTDVKVGDKLWEASLGKCEVEYFMDGSISLMNNFCVPLAYL
jgi:hypothetical protein